MARLTDERISELLPKSLMHETELESLASEVRELRAELKTSEYRTNEQCRDKARIGTEYAAEVERLAKEMDEFIRQRDAYQRNWLALLSATGETCHLNALEWIQAAKCRESVEKDHLAEIEHLTRERDEANIVREKLTAENKRLLLRLRDADTAAIELDEARDLLREFRGLFSDKGRCNSGDLRTINCCDRYDARFGQQQPEPSGELVPWDADTRPRGPVIFRNGGIEYMLVSWKPAGVTLEAGFRNWLELATLYWEWSRDGITWERCGVRK